jgi:hypothetical protein
MMKIARQRPGMGCIANRIGSLVIYFSTCAMETVDRVVGSASYSLGVLIGTVYIYIRLSVRYGP